MTNVRPSGLDRIRASADANGWEEYKPDRHRGYTGRTRFTKGIHHINVDHSVRGGITGADRSFGSDRYANAGTSKAERVILWMSEEFDTSGSPRGRVFAAAQTHGWEVRSTTFGVTYSQGNGRATLEMIDAWYTAEGQLKRAARNYGAPGKPRSVSGDPDDRPEEIVIGWLAEPAETAAQPVIRPALPQTPDRKLLAVLDALKADLADLTAKARKAKAGTVGEIRPDALATLSGDLEDLTTKVRDAGRQALYLWAERQYDAHTAEVLRGIHAKEARP